ncbi:5-methyltetrahydropteroyltriglutamate--homocysteine S-methyltransferase [Paenibacillus dakarensis]|uniref:5-methyltetrahydropteroyltriglutamate-- homocysteine S-methyltransferase n=1 Tax=Paenibacillus dakarensis TaxID=1527293 RepID=UPI0006D52BC4|nr:5-methyltetrahydropteroyltriglutamate--homocysteine S-methyltransferase [Paenibacillus dakarensis]
MKTSIIGYPRIGANRQLKFTLEKYFKDEITAVELQEQAKQLRQLHWIIQQEYRIDYIPSNDFSFYDTTLDTAVLFNIVPDRYRKLNLSAIDTYFAMARGYQGPNGDVKALAMKKWFNTNYHYIVPELEDGTSIELTGSKPFDDFKEALAQGIRTKPVVLGAFTLLKLLRFTGKKNIADVKADFITSYSSLLDTFNTLGAEWVQFDEPALVKDLTLADIQLFQELYTAILGRKGASKVLVQTYFGDVRDCYSELTKLDFDGIGLDFAEGLKNIDLIEQYGFPTGKQLFAGVINGKNIWRNQFEKTISIVGRLQKHCHQIILNTSCSLLHVPYSLEQESKLSSDHKKHFAFAQEKLSELAELKIILAEQHEQVSNHPLFTTNKALFNGSRVVPNQAVQQQIAALEDKDFIRLPEFEAREELQKEAFQLPLLPTTTIGSFAQTQDVRANRASFKKGSITEEQYVAFNKKKIAECVQMQERIGLDVLVHGEFERNDMVEYFGECLDGYLFTEKAWVQSYGTRCVKPPIVWGDISRSKPMTVDYSVYAQSLTSKPMKGMLTGPITILNWSFPREDISLKESALQIALAIREEVLDLEQHHIRIIQIDEAALREKLPLRRSDWNKEYLDWAIPAFRLVHSGVQAETQIHTHMCYSEFEDIIKEIDAMDTDVITFEASRSDLSLIDVLKRNEFKTEVGPGIYDIHSPRIPGVKEMKLTLTKMLEKLPAEKLWVNPDCGLKTRNTKEIEPSLTNMVQAAQEVRQSL